MFIESFHEPQSGTWTYLLADETAGEAAVIDPVWVYDSVSGMASTGFIDAVLARATGMGFSIRWVLETHAHADHLSAAAIIRRRTGAKIGASRGICGVQATFARLYNLPEFSADGRQFDRLLGAGDTISLGELRIGVLETPGHTNDSITYLVKDAAFIGDTLFAPGFGSARCDFPGGDAGRLFDSIQKLYALPDETRLFLCHDYPGADDEPVNVVTVAESKRENIHVRADTRREDYVAMRESRDAQLSLPKLILPAIQVNILAGDPPPAESNGFSYLKIPFNAAFGELLAVDD